MSSAANSSNFYKPSPKKPKYTCTSLYTNIKVLNMVREHINWSLHALQKHDVKRTAAHLEG
jgi:hypothetical protein